MEDLFEYDVFLCFAGKDEELVKPLWQEMSLSGLRVFWSDETLKENVGQSFFEVIQSALVKSRHFLLFCTDKAMLSEWVRIEYVTFFNECYLPSRRKRRLVLFKTKDFDKSSLPPFLRTIQLTESSEEVIKNLGGVDILMLKRENKRLNEKVKLAEGEIFELKGEITKRTKAYKALQGRFRDHISLKEHEERLKEREREIWKKVDLVEKQDVDIQSTGSEIKAGAILEKEIKKQVFTFAYIPPGEFNMGSPSDEPGRRNDEILHKVTLIKGFYMQTTQVTQGQWKAVMGDNPSNFKECGDDCPVETVSWNDVNDFIKKLNELNGSDGKYRLPTEAEWEYAARAGTDTPFAFGKCLSTDDANYSGNHPLEGCPKGEYRRKTIPVGSLKANNWGLYDMHGNVWEWVEDRYGDYPAGSVSDPVGPESGSIRVVRGGGWNYDASCCRSAFRDGNVPGIRINLSWVSPCLFEVLNFVLLNFYPFKIFLESNMGNISKS